MAVRRVLRYPHEALRARCSPVQTFDAEVRAVVRDLVETMYAHPGAVGIAAPQIGVPLRIVVIDVAAKTTRDALRVLVNPEIAQVSRTKLVREGCLSFPDYLANVRRGLRCTYRAFDAHGEPYEGDARHLEAIAVQHEVDHLDGVLLVDQVAALGTDLLRRGEATDTGGD